MRVMIVDDEQPCLDDMIFLLSKQDGVEIAGAFTKPADAWLPRREYVRTRFFSIYGCPGERDRSWPGKY